MNRLPNRIPTAVGVFLVLSIITVIGVVFEAASRGQARASVSIEPKDVTVTNLSDSSFTIVWRTDAAASGMITVTDTAGKKRTAFDERDMTGKIGKYTTHSVSLKNLPADTQFEANILSNGRKYPTDKSGYRFKTAATLQPQAEALDPAYGAVRTTEGTTADGGIVLLTIEGGQTLSTLVKPSGTWIIPLSSVRSQDLLSFLPAQDKLTEQIVVHYGGQTARAATDTFNDSPVPDMVIGQTYDFRNLQAKKQTRPQLAVAHTTTPAVQSKPAAVLGAQTTRGQQTVTQRDAFVMTAPLNGAKLVTNLPLIQGIGIPGKSVTVTIGINRPFTGTTSVKPDGTWRYTPSRTLAPGRQSVTAVSLDSKGKPKAITHTFDIFKSGSQVLGDATPSATIEPTLTLTPTLSATETGTPTLLPTPTATEAGQPMPTSGSVLPLMILIVLGFGLVGAGAVTYVR